MRDWRRDSSRILLRSIRATLLDCFWSIQNRHCEERSDEASKTVGRVGLLRFARNAGWTALERHQMCQAGVFDASSERTVRYEHYHDWPGYREGCFPSAR
jgi:hypothetical protein